MEIFQNLETLHSHQLQIKKLGAVIQMLPAIEILTFIFVPYFFNNKLTILNFE
jgi:hypothetical protein